MTNADTSLAARPELHLSGQRLRTALETLVAGCDGQGGIERFVDALKLKSGVFVNALSAGEPDRDALARLAAFMPTVRRRIAGEFDRAGLERIGQALALLLDDIADTSTTDQRVRAFCAQYPDDRGHRWVRDFAAEVLHNVDPERYPLMTRWVWDRRANTGVVREIWFGDDVDNRTLDVADGYATHLVLREELSVFLSDNGFYRDVTWYVDLLLAQVYAGYISEQGGTYLRTDFSLPEDPMLHTRRMLGLDGVRAGSARLRVKTVDGEVFAADDDADGDEGTN